MKKNYLFHYFFFISLIFFGKAQASELIYDGSLLGLEWIVPFGGLIFSIALLPLFTPSFWHQHYGKVVVFWSLAFLIPFTQTASLWIAFLSVFDTFLHEYFPFMVIVFALISITGGIQVSLPGRGTPESNLFLLTLGTLLSGWIGTTGASLLLIRPLLRANRWRHYKTHLVIFFIFLVSNMGGGLTPLGDPPIFVGFLKGIPFFWTLQNLWKPLLFISSSLLLIIYGLDYYFFSREDLRLLDTTPSPSFHLKGIPNVFLLSAVLLTIMGYSLIPPAFIKIGGSISLSIPSLCRDSLLILLGLFSQVITPPPLKEANHFSWEPLKEVGILFAGLFMTLIPVSAILHAKEAGSLAFLLQMVTSPDGTPYNSLYFWLSGLLSAFLDNTPTYLFFFNLAGGDPSLLTTTLQKTLISISLGSVCMGAMTYIGNAPNFMVRIIARHHHIVMPSFFGFLGWACLFLLPLFCILAYLFL